MKKFNQNFKSLNTSLKRLKKIKELFNKYKPKIVEDLTPLLIYHSKNPEENICRHGKIMTVGSGVFEVSTEITAFYSINKSPCESKFNKKEIKLT
jgi:glycine cleavage system regulatory protein